MSINIENISEEDIRECLNIINSHPAALFKILTGLIGTLIEKEVLSYKDILELLNDLEKINNPTNQPYHELSKDQTALHELSYRLHQIFGLNHIVD